MITSSGYFRKKGICIISSVTDAGAERDTQREEGRERTIVKSSGLHGQMLLLLS